MAKKKTPEEKADEERRYALARAAVTDADFEPFFTDPNQSIRNVAAMNPRASAAVLERFADDPFWSTKLAVVDHPNTSRETRLCLADGSESACVRIGKRGRDGRKACRRARAPIRCEYLPRSRPRCGGACWGRPVARSRHWK